LEQKLSLTVRLRTLHLCVSITSLVLKAQLHLHFMQLHCFSCATFATLVAKCSYGKAVVQLPLRGVQLFELARKLWMFS